MMQPGVAPGITRSYEAIRRCCEVKGVGFERISRIYMEHNPIYVAAIFGPPAASTYALL